MWLKRNQLVVNDIMTLAMFPIMTKWNYKQAERWQNVNFLK